MQFQGTIGIYYKTWCSYSQAALAVTAFESAIIEF